MADDSKIAENIYFDLYGLAAENADYLQPDTTALRLPEAVVSALAATLILVVLKGIDGDISRGFDTEVKEMIFFGRKLKQVETDELIQQLKRSLPKVRQHEAELTGAKTAIYHELLQLGFSDRDSKAIATRAIDLITRELDHE